MTAPPGAAAGARLLAPVRPIFRAVVTTVVPEATQLTEPAWQEVEAIVEQALALRPPRMRRQVVLFLRVLDALARGRHLRGFAALDEARRTELLTALQDGPVGLLRRGAWGVRTLSLMGYYARPAAAAAIGYRADPRGWDARP